MYLFQKIFSVINLIIFLSFSQNLSANENHNIRINSENKDFGNKLFSNNKKVAAKENIKKEIERAPLFYI